jgi:hypothetical protein
MYSVGKRLNTMKDDTSRRRFLAGAGAAGVIGFAGCAGGGGSGGSGDSGGGSGGSGDSGGGSGGSGDSGGGSGGSGDSGGDSGGETGGEATDVNITLAPTGWQGIVMDHIHNETNILADAMPSGYAPNVQKSWEGAALFASGGPDFSTMSAFEASRLGVERGIDLAAVGKLAPLFMGWWTLKGSEFDPANSGSVQSSIDMLANQNAQVGIGSWAGGDVPGYTTVLDSVYGYTFREGSDNDFNTVTADYNAVPQLMIEGQLEAGGTSPSTSSCSSVRTRSSPRASVSRRSTTSRAPSPSWTRTARPSSPSATRGTRGSRGSSRTRSLASKKTRRSTSSSWASRRWPRPSTSSSGVST